MKVFTYSLKMMDISIDQKESLVKRLAEEPVFSTKSIDCVEVLHAIIYANGYVRCPCKGHGVGCLWFLLLMPNTGGA